MADPEHVEMVKRGAAAIAEWRIANPNPIDLRGADLSRANLQGANLQGANLQGADLQDADLQDANLQDANLSRANLQDANLKGANLKKANISQAGLNKANLSGANLNLADLSGANFSNASLSEANFNNAKQSKPDKLKRLSFSNAFPLDGANFSRADLRSADFSGTSLQKQIFVSADLSDAVLTKADLSHADLQGAKLIDSELFEAKLDSADFANADLRRSRGIRFDNSHIRSARFSPNSSDPWSVLRRGYTGTRLAFVMALTVAAFLPYVAKTLFWVGVNRVERQTLPLATTAITKTLSVLEKTTKPLPPRLKDWTIKAREYVAKVDPWIEHYRQSGGEISVETQDVERAIDLLASAADAISSERQLLAEHREELQDAEDLLSQARQLIRVVRPSGTVKQRRIIELLLGRDQGFWPAMLIAVLLVYNVLRGVLTYHVGPLREEEERTGITPPWNGYRGYSWLWKTHRIARVLFVVSIISCIWHLGAVLWTPVLVPG